MTISILIPWRTDNGQRQRVWDFLRPLWTKTDFEICIGEDDAAGPFNCSRALNRAAAQATGNVFVPMGADHYPNTTAVDSAARLAQRNAAWQPVFGGVYRLSQRGTDELLTVGQPSYSMVEHIDTVCKGINAVTRGSWETVGGMDERYAGWGWEDDDLVRRLQRRYGSVTPPSIRVIALWHESAHQDLSYGNPNRRLFESEA
jgi:hypothetical protein